MTKNNFSYEIAKPEDAQSFIDLQRCLAEHEYFLLTTNNEAAKMDADKQSEMFLQMQSPSSLSHVFLAKVEKTVVGFLGYSEVMPTRAKHIASRVAVGVHPSYRRMGIGSGLFRQFEHDCIHRSISRIEFTVMINNKAAIALYIALGYVIEGKRLQSVSLDGHKIDEYYMAKLLD